MKKRKAMPYGMCRNDSIYGTIVATNHSGIRIHLDMDDYEADCKVFAFAFSGGKIGQRVLASINYFNEKHDSFAATIDSYLPEAATISVPQQTTIPDALKAAA